MDASKARMLGHEWYLDSPALAEERRQCWRQLDRFNATGADDDELRQEILSGLFAEFGPGAVVLPRFQCSYGTLTRVGAGTFVNSDALFMDDGGITIGADVRIGPRVQLLTATHPTTDHDRRREGWERPLPITIGDNTWLGGGVIVCPGVRIADNAVIGAGSVVTHDIPSHALAVGNPARVVKRL
ncbi:galactoside O-acetyltransferase [Actinokineospora globicatena]|uniref:Galactoside O-acetyltransferase n=2 Tax=Actinokineospora globicatena TaxID=103729 RepID=A0A9W6V8M0_9PSEU|nr:sugar O-acetyltransferase [Actinokineospora globicatena]GLW94115.1 galactoside O-acetyltransferase [Actinokineospora globicatena]